MKQEGRPAEKVAKADCEYPIDYGKVNERKKSKQKSRETLTGGKEKWQIMQH